MALSLANANAQILYPGRCPTNITTQKDFLVDQVRMSYKLQLLTNLHHLLNSSSLIPVPWLVVGVRKVSIFLRDRWQVYPCWVRFECQRSLCDCAESTDQCHPATIAACNQGNGQSSRRWKVKRDSSCGYSKARQSVLDPQHGLPELLRGLLVQRCGQHLSHK